MIKLSPEDAWRKHLLKAAKSPGWIEDSKPISDKLPINKRELFGLIILAHIQNHLCKSKDWYVGYDSSASEPNDGLVSNDKERIDIEHKLVPQFTDQKAVEAILSTYAKYAIKGPCYGRNRTLIIFPNVETKHLVRISSLRDQIKNDCPFDRVLLMHSATKENNTTIIIHVSEHYPDFGLAEVNLNRIDGEASVPLCRLK